MRKTILFLLACISGILIPVSCGENSDFEYFGGIYGMISDAETKAPVAGAQVILSPGNVTAVTGSDGNYEFRNLEAGQYKLSAYSAGYSANTRQVTIVSGENIICDMQLMRERSVSGMELSTNILDFGDEYDELTFSIMNVGTSGTLDWHIDNVTADWLYVSPLDGSTDMGKSSSVKVAVDRSRITSGETTIFHVNAAGGSLAVMVSVDMGTGGSGGDGPGDGGSGDVTYGLYAYYEFEGGFDDASGNRLNGFGSNSPEFVDGVRAGSKSVKFSRISNSYMTVPYPIIDSKNMTISFWCKDMDDGNVFYLVSSYDNDPMFLLSMSDGALKFVVTRHSVWYQYDSMLSFSHVDINDGGWHHIVLCSDFNITSYGLVTTTLYVDGVKMDVVTEEANPFSEDGNSSQSSYGTGIKFVMGGEVRISSDRVLNGANMTIDNFRVYDTRKLSDEEIRQLYEYER